MFKINVVNFHIYARVRPPGFHICHFTVISTTKHLPITFYACRFSHILSFEVWLNYNFSINSSD